MTWKLCGDCELSGTSSALCPACRSGHVVPVTMPEPLLTAEETTYLDHLTQPVPESWWHRSTRTRFGWLLLAVGVGLVIWCGMGGRW
jgi:hypothetical protein